MNSKDSDQPVHMHTLIKAVAVSTHYELNVKNLLAHNAALAIMHVFTDWFVIWLLANTFEIPFA